MPNRTSPWPRRSAPTPRTAYTSFEEDTLGTLAPGAHADFQLYDRNPFDLNPEEWLDLTPSAVYVAGEKQPLSREHP